MGITVRHRGADPGDSPPGPRGSTPFMLPVHRRLLEGEQLPLGNPLRDLSQALSGVMERCPLVNDDPVFGGAR
jgi:hypothetical protein